MTIKVAINGYGRIGRNVLRALYEAGRTDQLKVVAINDLGNAGINAHLTQHDTAHGRFPATVEAGEDHMTVNGDRIQVLAEPDPSKLPWGELGVDVVLECTGRFRSRELASAHLRAGAKKVVVSAPASGVDATIVYGVNHQILKASDSIISNASCTTNCLAPLVKTIDKAVGLVHGLMTTIHAYTNDQVLSDVYHTDLRRARSAPNNQIPTSTGAAIALGLVMPEMKNRLDGYSMRVPTLNVSVIDLTFTAGRDTSVEEINQALKAASEGEFKEILTYNTLPLVSSDFNHNPYSSIFDATQTRMMGPRLVKVLSWYDNEWGFSNRMLDTTLALMRAR